MILFILSELINTTLCHRIDNSSGDPAIGSLRQPGMGGGDAAAGRHIRMRHEEQRTPRVADRRMRVRPPRSDIGDRR
ncbi:MAG: hypothetical protein IRZ00_17565 [Gemmatimonadetes bacterium]|nr:hypothetical protein [Gemmatimonadota bacterium]